MKKYIQPEIEKIAYKVEDCLSSSANNGEYNIEFELPNWEDDLI